MTPSVLTLLKNREIFWRDIHDVSDLLLRNLEDSGNHASNDTLPISDYNEEYEYLDIFVNSGSNDHLEKCLILTILDNNLKIAKSLLMKGAKPQSEAWNGDSLIYSYIFKRPRSRKETFETLCKYGLNTRDIRNSEGENLLHQLMINYVRKDDHDAADIALIFIDAGVQVNDCTKNLWAPLHLAVDRRVPIALTANLIQKGANINQKGRYELSPLLLAVLYDNHDVVCLLVANGADINDKDGDGWTVLHYACYKQTEKTIKLLLLKGADVRAKSNNGETPFSVMNSKKEETYLGCSFLMIKEFARLTFGDHPIPRMDLDLLKNDISSRASLKMFVTELNQMANDKFHNDYSYYTVLKMSKRINKLAHLMNDEEFSTKLVNGLHKFLFYGYDLRIIFEQATQVKEKNKKLVFLLKSIFGNILPDTVLMNLAEHLTVEDLPLR